MNGSPVGIRGGYAPQYPRDKIPAVLPPSRLSQLLAPYVTAEQGPLRLYYFSSRAYEGHHRIGDTLRSFWSVAFDQPNNEVERIIQAKEFYDQANLRSDGAEKTLLLNAFSLIMHTCFDVLEQKKQELATLKDNNKKDILVGKIRNFEAWVDPSSTLYPEDNLTQWVSDSGAFDHYKSRKGFVDSFASVMFIKPSHYQHILANSLLKVLETRLFRVGSDNFWDFILSDFQRASRQSECLNSEKPGDKHDLETKDRMLDRIGGLPDNFSTVFFGFYSPKIIQHQGKEYRLDSSHAFMARFYKFAPDQESDYQPTFGLAIQNFGFAEVDNARSRVGAINPTSDGKGPLLKGPIFFHFGSDFSLVRQTVDFLFEYSRKKHEGRKFFDEFQGLVKLWSSYNRAGKSFSARQDISFGFIQDETFFYEKKEGGFCTPLSMLADLKQVMGQFFYEHYHLNRESHPLKTDEEYEDYRNDCRALAKIAWQTMELSIIEEFTAQSGPFISDYSSLSLNSGARKRSIIEELIQFQQLDQTRDNPLLPTLPEPFQSKVLAIPVPLPPVPVAPVVVRTSCSCVVS